MDPPGVVLRRHLDVHGASYGRWIRRPDVDRQEQGEGLHGEGDGDHLRRRSRDRRGEGRTRRDRRVPQDTRAFSSLGWKNPERCLAGRITWNRQDPAGQSGGRRSGCALFLDQWIRLCRNVCRCGRGTCERSVRAGQETRTGHHLHRRT